MRNLGTYRITVPTSTRPITYLYRPASQDDLDREVAKWPTEGVTAERL